MTSAASTGASVAGRRLVRICVFGLLLASGVVSHRLWWLPRKLPVLGLVTVDSWFNNAFLTLLVLIVGVLLVGWNRTWLTVRTYQHLVGALVGLLLVLVTADLTRAQPWVYFYGVLLTLFVTFPPLVRLRITRVFLSSMYVWAGLNKCTYGYLYESVSMLAQAFPSIPMNLSVALVALIPPGEILIGVGLLTRRFSAPARWMAYGLHGGILMLLIASKLNPVV